VKPVDMSRVVPIRTNLTGLSLQGKWILNTGLSSKIVISDKMANGLNNPEFIINGIFLMFLRGKTTRFLTGQNEHFLRFFYPSKDGFFSFFFA
jgi:hypothetical protein